MADPTTLPPDAVPLELTLSFPENRHVQELAGAFSRNFAKVEQLLSVQIAQRGNEVSLAGEARERAAEILGLLYDRIEQGKPVEPEDIDALVRLGRSGDDTGTRAGDQIEMFTGGDLEIGTRKKTVNPRTPAQQAYTRSLFQNELAFGIGPAGTGKTYLAVAVAVNRMMGGHVDRIVLCRPAVEAGERLGFLPGTEKEKLDPYMRPLYDALHDFLPGRQLQKLMEENRIEIAPLAFMRGRTLANAYVVLDEAQNATAMQMKMFLTRLGQGSRMAVTGDRTQIDLPRGVPSGLIEAERILSGVSGIGFTYFSAADVVRHPLVARIIAAYDRDDPAR